MEPTLFTLQANETRLIEVKESGDYVVELNGAGAHADIQGAFLAEGKTHIEVNLFIVHKAPHTSAQTILKGVAKDTSKIRFFGRIKIDAGCPNTQSFLEERILVLSERAQAEAVPEL